VAPHKLSLSFRNCLEKKSFILSGLPNFFLHHGKGKKFSEVIDADRPSFTFNTDKDRETSKGIQKVMAELVKVDANQILDWTNCKKISRIDPSLLLKINLPNT
jgi:hypothetical protein